MMRLISTLFIMMMIVFPSEGRSLTFENNAFRNTLSVLSQSPELKNKIDPFIALFTLFTVTNNVAEGFCLKPLFF